MFNRRPHGLMDALAALLCLWAAAYHTPIGALARTLTAKMVGLKTSARPMLAYYSGGVWEAARSDVPYSAPNVPDPEQLAVIPPGPAMGRAAWATWHKASPERRRVAQTLCTRYGLAANRLDVAATGPEAATVLIDKAKAELGSEDAAVLALFAGYDTARYAAERTKAENKPLTLEHLATRVPGDAADAVDATSQALLLGTAFALSWPVPITTRVTSPFGWRTNPVTFAQQLHSGVDLAVPTGTPVKSTFAGTVTRASEDALNGKLVIVDHGRGVTTAYCHNSYLKVRVGQKVNEGDVLAESGSTGRSTGPHVHYQLELAHRPVDPFLFKGRSETMAWMPPPVPTPVHTGSPSKPPRAPNPAPLKAAFEKGQTEGGTDVLQ